MTNRKVLTDNSQMIKEATRREQEAMKPKEGDFVVGFCQGIIEESEFVFTGVWCSIISKNNTVSVGGRGNIILLKHLTSKYKEGHLIEIDVESYLQSQILELYEIIN